MRLPHIFIALTFITCSTAQEPAPAKDAKPLKVSVSLEMLKERSEYTALDKQAVEAIARLAEARWTKELSGFSYQRVERFSAGGVSHWISIWSHGKTLLEFALVPGGKFQMGSSTSEENRKEDELQHLVTLDPFRSART